MFHGQDPGNEIKERILRWFRGIDGFLRERASRSEIPADPGRGLVSFSPLPGGQLLSCICWKGGLPGNPEGLKPEELHRQAWPLVEPVFNTQRERAVARFRELSGTGRTLTDLKKAVSAAHQGRIESSCSSPVGLQVWGRFDPDKDQLRDARISRPRRRIPVGSGSHPDPAQGRNGLCRQAGGGPGPDASGCDYALLTDCQSGRIH